MNIEGRRGNVSVSTGLWRREDHVVQRKRRGRRALAVVAETFEAVEVNIRVVLRFFVGGEVVGIFKMSSVLAGSRLVESRGERRFVRACPSARLKRSSYEGNGMSKLSEVGGTSVRSRRGV
jgi:hypothetical protein